MNGQQALIRLHDGRVIEVDLTEEDIDEVQRLVDAWMSGRQGGVDFNARNGSVSFEYRDIVRVDFPDAAA